MKFPVLRSCKHGEYIILRTPKATWNSRLREEEKKLCKDCAKDCAEGSTA